MRRKLITLASLSVVLVVLLLAGFSSASVDEPIRRNCTGYTVIEANTGINCYGDTIKLTRKHGFYEIVAHEGIASAK